MTLVNDSFLKKKTIRIFFIDYCFKTNTSWELTTKNKKRNKTSHTTQVGHVHIAIVVHVKGSILIIPCSFCCHHILI